jgi:excisionase family DNA binding protein
MSTLDPKGLAQLIGVSKDTILRLVQARKIEHERLGHRTIRFTDEQIKKFLRERRVVAQ